MNDHTTYNEKFDLINDKINIGKANILVEAMIPFEVMIPFKAYLLI